MPKHPRLVLSFSSGAERGLSYWSVKDPQVPVRWAHVAPETSTHLFCSSGTVWTRFWQYWTISENSKAKVLMLICWLEDTNPSISKSDWTSSWAQIAPRCGLYWAVFQGYLTFVLFPGEDPCWIHSTRFQSLIHSLPVFAERYLVTWRQNGDGTETKECCGALLWEAIRSRWGEKIFIQGTQ